MSVSSAWFAAILLLCVCLSITNFWMFNSYYMIVIKFFYKGMKQKTKFSTTYPHNGIFHRNTHALSIAQRIINECLYIAKENGILINAKDVIDKLILISKLSEGQLISTYQDILNKRKTEIESLNFAFVNRANELNKNNSVVETKLLGELLLLKSELNQ